MPKSARILPSKTTEITADNQKLTFLGSLLNDSEKYWGMAKAGMFISKMPSSATPRSASMSLSRSRSDTGAAAGGASVVVVISFMG